MIIPTLPLRNESQQLKMNLFMTEHVVLGDVDI